MKRFFVFIALSCILAASALAQEKNTDFSGTWVLDVSKSKLDERARIESMTMTVSQTEKGIKIETATKRQAPPVDAQRGGGGGFGRGGGGDSAFTYTLDGKETTIQQESQFGQIPIILKAKIDGSSLKLSQSRTINSPQGEVSISTKDKLSLSVDGKTLTVDREQSSPRGSNSSTLVFTKK